MAFRGRPQAVEDQARAEERRREEFLSAFVKNPYFGEPSLDDAIAGSKRTSQAEVLARLINRENLFISGLAGAGKTTVIETFVKLLDAEYRGAFEVAVTATTGIAASLLNGRTIHSWAGLGISTEPFDPKHVEPSLRRKRTTVKYTDVLIIDEISMMPAYLFTKLDAVLKWARDDERPFGGIQLVVLGDFLQLPPVVKGDDDKLDSNFAIHTQAWEEAGFNYCYLDRVYRASDKKLKNLLLRISRGKVDEITRELVNSRINAPQVEGKVYTTLYTTNRNVDAYNEKRFAENSNPVIKSTMTTDNAPHTYVEKAKKQYAHVPEELLLKKDTVVMLTQNSILQGHRMANGSMGVIVGFVNGNTPVVRFNNGQTIAVAKKGYEYQEDDSYRDSQGKVHHIKYTRAIIYQVPLKLAYAITVHKSQGQTFDGVVMDLTNCFQPGLGYVALSRVRAFEDMVITGLADNAFAVSDDARRISVTVSKKALEGRKQFLQDKASYENLLENIYARKMLWPEEEAARSRKAEGY